MRHAICILIALSSLPGCADRALSAADPRDDSTSGEGMSVRDSPTPFSADLAGATDLPMAHHDLSTLTDGSSRPDSMGGSDMPGAASDLATPPDLSVPVDLAAPQDLSVPIDFAAPPDLAVPVDLATPPDLAVPADLARPRDLGPPPDLTMRPRDTIAFASPTTLEVTGPGRTAEGLVHGDFDEDGNEDVVIANWGLGLTGDVAVLLGKGDGSFAPHFNVYAGEGPFGVTAGDLDGDGHLDLLPSTSSLRSMLNNGHAAFGAMDFAGEIVRTSVLVDTDHDGVLDVFAAEMSPRLMRRWRGTGGGAFSAGPAFPLPITPFGMVVGRFTTGHERGLAVYGYLPNDPASASLQILAIGQDGNLAPAVRYDSRPFPVDIAVGDLDGDGVDDLVTSSTAGGFGVYLAKGDGSFNEEQPTSGPRSHGLALVDVDTDGRLDVVVAQYSTGELAVYRGLGTGSFGPALVFPIGQPVIRMISADLDRDGVPDIVTLNLWDTVTVLLNRSF